MMRKIHRWISFPLILFLMFVTGSGVILQYQELGELVEPERPKPTATALPEDALLLEQVQKALDAARKAKADFPAQRLDLDFSGGDGKARFGVSPRGGPSIEVNLKSGDAKVEMQPKPNLHVQMIQLHTGKMFGPAGLVIMGLVSLIFLVLTFTGFLVYFNMWRRRKSAGKGGLFWK